MGDRRQAYGLSVRGSLALLVALLIFCQLFYILVMWMFWRETKLELRQQLRAKEVVEQVECIRLNEKDVLLVLAEAAASDGRPVFPSEINKGYFTQKTAEFRTLAPRMIGLNEQLINVAIDIDQACGELRGASQQSGNVKVDTANATRRLKQELAVLNGLLEEMRSRFKDFRREHAEKLMLANTVDFVYMALLFVVVMSVAILLTIGFAKVIERRISALVLNSELAAEGKALLPPLRGRDEFSAVDTAFRKMTAALNAESENLRLSESKTRTIIESLPLGLLLVLPTGAIEGGNNTAALLLGVEQNSLLQGQEFDRFFSRELASSSLNPVASNDLVRRCDDQSFPAEILQKIYDSPEGPRVLVIFADISERERIRKLREEFVAVVSHEIRTPLTSMRAFLHLLKQNMLGELTEEGTSSVRQMESVNRRLISLVNDLVDAGKIELGHFDLEAKQITMAPVIENAVDSAAALAGQYDITIALPEEDAVVIADQDRTTQVLVNLLSNAIKYSHRGGTVTVKLFIENNYAKIMVEDHGTGIPSEEVVQIFDRFGQVTGEPHKRKDSSGLGLYIAKDIVEKQGGKIGVHSEEGKGSVFWFTIPLAEDQHGQEGIIATTGPPSI